MSSSERTGRTLKLPTGPDHNRPLERRSWLQSFYPRLTWHGKPAMMADPHADLFRVSLIRRFSDRVSELEIDPPRQTVQQRQVRLDRLAELRESLFALEVLREPAARLH
jgi:hypothetical protein